MSYKRRGRLDIVWYTGVAFMFFVLCINAFIRGRDSEEIVGLIAHSLVLLFYLGLLFAFVLLGTDYVFKLATRRKKSGKLDSDVRQYMKTVVAFGCVEGAIIVLTWLHPFGYIISITVGVAVFVTASLIAARRIRAFRENPALAQKITELQDKLLESTDEPNEPARWVP